MHCMRIALREQVTDEDVCKQIEENFGWKTTVIQPEGNPEKNEKGISGLEALK